MKPLPLHHFGTDRQGIVLYGNPKIQIEPSNVSIRFPGGEVTVTRTPKGFYWAHITVAEDGRFLDARMDCTDKHASDSPQVLNDPALYHLAVAVGRRDDE